MWYVACRIEHGLLHHPSMPLYKYNAKEIIVMLILSRVSLASCPVARSVPVLGSVGAELVVMFHLHVPRASDIHRRRALQTGSVRA